jgi:hypothetical protein
MASSSCTTVRALDFSLQKCKTKITDISVFSFGLVWNQGKHKQSGDSCLAASYTHNVSVVLSSEGLPVFCIFCLNTICNCKSFTPICLLLSIFGQPLEPSWQGTALLIVKSTVRIHPNGIEKISQ